MTQLQLDRQIAAATGETLRTVQRRGFSIIDPSARDLATETDDQPPQWIDWDQELAVA